MIEAELTMQLTLTRKTFERLSEIAVIEKKRPEDLIGLLVEEGLDSHYTGSKILQQISENYCNRLSKAGKLNQSTESVMQDLHDSREQIANELYP
jgi:hypothetical protein